MSSRSNLPSFRALEPETTPPADLLPACRAFIAQSRWTFASSMPHIPHQYALRHQARATGIEKAFDAFALVIDDHGYEGMFAGVKRMYLNVDGWRFWKMEPIGVPPISVINRARIEPKPEQLSFEGADR